MHFGKRRFLFVLITDMAMLIALLILRICSLCNHRSNIFANKPTIVFINSLSSRVQFFTKKSNLERLHFGKRRFHFVLIADMAMFIELLLSQNTLFESSVFHKKKQPRKVAFWKNWQWPRFPARFQASMFGAKGLYFCVRDGNRCYPFAKITSNGRMNY